MTGTITPDARPLPYRLLHNLDARFSRGYLPGDRLVEGHRGTVELHGTTSVDPAAQATDDGGPSLVSVALSVACDQIFALHNRDDRPDGRDAPSLSVGDVVVLGEAAFTVVSLGFEIVVVDPADVHPGPWREVVATLRD